jgi:hypothetical protein
MTQKDQIFVVNVMIIDSTLENGFECHYSTRRCNCET